MGTTAQKLQKLLNTKNAIKSILEKKGKNPTDNFESYIDQIDDLTAINGVIEEYKVAAGENISAGDFVEFINFIQKAPKTDSILAAFSRSGMEISASWVNNNYIFIGFGDYSDAGHLRGMILKIQDNQIEVIIDKQLSSFPPSNLQVFSINTNKVLILNREESIIKGRIIELSETFENITIKSENIIQNDSEGQGVLIDTNKILFLHRDNASNSRLYAKVLKINENSGAIEEGEDIQISSAKYSWFDGYVHSFLFNSNQIFISYDEGELTASGKNYYKFITIEDMNIQIHTSYMDTMTPIKKVLPFSDGKFFILEIGATKAFGKVVSINNNYEIILESSLTLPSSIQNAYIVDANLLKGNKIFIGYGNYSDYTLHGMILSYSLDNKTLSIYEENQQLSSASYSGVSTQVLTNKEDKIIILHASDNLNYYLKAYIINDLFATTSSKQEIQGIAKENGIAKDIIKIYQK